MAHVVFLRAANVGGRNVFRPAQVAAWLAHLGVVNVGAAGTFVVRSGGTATAIRREIQTRLSFEPEIVVRPAAEIVALVRGEPFRGVTFSKDVRGWVAVLCGRPKSRPELPIAKPAGRSWGVRFDHLDKGFALGLWHRRPGGFVFPNQVVERAVGVPATTRWWETLVRVADLVES
jgi:uncharacterized protein (DUF1697 family)